MTTEQKGLDLLRKFEEAEKTKASDMLTYEQRKLELSRFLRKLCEKNAASRL